MMYRPVRYEVDVDCTRIHHAILNPKDCAKRLTTVMSVSA